MTGSRIDPKGAAARRIGDVVALTPAECKYLGDDVVEPDNLLDLKIDESYQRAKVTSEVNELISVLEAGGMFPQTAAIAIRPDGSRYIADGQQKWWACVAAVKPLRVSLFEVANYDAEKKLFDVLNNRRQLNGATRVNAWHGEAAKVIQLLESSPDSAIRNNIHMGPSKSKHGYPNTLVLRGLVALTHGYATGPVRDSLVNYDAAYKRNPRWSTRAALDFSKILAGVFPPRDTSAFTYGAAIVMGKTCRSRWEGLLHTVSWPHPSAAQMEDMSHVPWREIMPTGSSVWHARGVEVVESIWPLPATSFTKRVG
jgi:hypothetical protein